MKKVCFSLLLLASLAVYGQSDDRAGIEKALTDYMDGTSQARPDQIREAFHPDLNLYSVDENEQLKVWKGSDYISRFEGKEPNNRLGRILSIDYENNAAMAKVEISYPGRPNVYIDYFMLLKLEGKWTIVHKMFTSIPRE